MRKLNHNEETLLSKLLNIAKIDVDLNKIEVIELNDGGMGSLGIGVGYESREFGQQVAEYQFKDSDGVTVSATLNIDTDGALYELDIFKTDFSPTRSLNS